MYYDNGVNVIKISVIMPIYNDEEKLNDAINSVLNQTLTEIELICVDDGSTDNSLSILNNLAEKDDRIRVFSQKNQGSGKARNKGISEAKGEYIAFLDSDDQMVDNDALNQLYTEAKKNNVDMASGGIQFVDKGKISYEFSCFKPITELKLRPVGDYCLPWYFYKNIFKRSLLIENDIRFPDLLRGQDPIFLVEILSHLDNFLEVPILYYSYVTPDYIKVDNSLKYYDYFVHYYLVFKLLMEDKKFKNSILRYSEILIAMKDRPIHINTVEELFKLLDVMDKIKSLYVKYGDINLTNKITSSFDELISKIEIEGFEISINKNQFLSDFYSEGIIVKDKKYNPKITFVLPVYNVEKYLPECLDSVINQTMDDIEIICIDDGSTDNSLEILKKYQKKDNRIKIFSFTNKGLGPARNRGIDRAHGEYVAFVDTDDWLELDFCEKIYENAKNNNSDIVLFNAIEEYETHQKERIYFNKETIENPKDFIFDFKWNSRFVLNNYFTAWSKLHRTKFLKENNIRFPSTLFEDIEFQVESFLKAKRISYNPTIFYHYRKENPESIMNSLKDDECFCIFGIIDNVENHIRNLNVYERFGMDFIKLKIRQFKEKFSSTTLLFKVEFFKKIKMEFIKMRLNEEILRKLPGDLVKFYNDILNSESYVEFYQITNNFNNKLHNFQFNKYFSYNSALFSNVSYETEIIVNEDSVSNIIVNQLQNDLLNNNLLMFKAYEKIKDLDIFNIPYFIKKTKYHSEIDSLLYYLYLGEDINNPTHFFDNEFYLKNYPNLVNFNIDPFVYFVLYGQYEGKNNINPNFQLRSPNRRLLNKEIKKINKYNIPEGDEVNLIISLTSFPKRIHNIKYTILSLFKQSVKPKKIVLYLAEEEFPNKENDIPLDLLLFKNWGLEIRWCENTRSYKKLIPALSDFPNEIIVTADDDVYYYEDWLKILWQEHEKYPQDIIAHRTRIVTFDENNNIDCYNKWDISYNPTEGSFLNFFTGVGGILYPKNSLHPDVFKKELFEELCPYGDDIWFWGMAILNNTKIRIPNNCIPYLNETEVMRELVNGQIGSLWAYNVGGGNDYQLKNLFNHYPKIKEKILNEKQLGESS